MTVLVMHFVYIMIIIFIYNNYSIYYIMIIIYIYYDYNIYYIMYDYIIIIIKTLLVSSLINTLKPNTSAAFLIPK